MEVKSHWGVILEGEDSTKIDLVTLLKELIEHNKLKCEIVSSHVSSYYSTPVKTGGTSKS